MHGLIGELGVGTVTASTLQMGLAMAGLFAGVGLVFMLTGGGLIWAGRGKQGDRARHGPRGLPSRAGGSDHRPLEGLSPQSIASIRRSHGNPGGFL